MGGLHLDTAFPNSSSFPFPLTPFIPPSTPSLPPSALNTILQKMLGEVDLWSLAQHQPQLFRKGGDYYEQVMHSYGSQLKDHTHFQFKEFSDKTFSYNAQKQCLEVCLGVDHVEVGPLTPQQVC